MEKSPPPPPPIKIKWSIPKLASHEYRGKPHLTLGEEPYKQFCFCSNPFILIMFTMTMTMTMIDNDNDLFARNTFTINGYGKHDNQTM